MVRLTEHRLDKASEYLNEADLLYREKIGTLPVLANLYHAMMNCLFALFNMENPGSIMHVDIIERFKREYAQKGVFDGKFTDALDFAFRVTHECNCEHMKPPAEEDIDKLLPVAKEFITVMNGFLHKE